VPLPRGRAEEEPALKLPPPCPMPLPVRARGLRLAPDPLPAAVPEAGPAAPDEPAGPKLSATAAARIAAAASLAG